MRYFLILLVFLPKLAFGQGYNNDYALVTEFNRARILHQVPQSLIFNHDLQQSVRVLAQNQIFFDCAETHKTCFGESLKRRFSRFYPHWQVAGEVWALGVGSPRRIVDSFLDSPLHASTILGTYNEAAGTILDRPTAFGIFQQAVGDFGGRVLYPEDTPVISGAVYDGYAWMTYDAPNPPTAAYVSIGNQDFSLKLAEGTAKRGIYKVAVKTPTGCEKVTFNVLSDSSPIVFPSGDWDNYIGDLCADPPPLLNRVRIRINASGNRMFKGTFTFRLETLPNQNPQKFAVTYGDGAGIMLPTAPFLKHTKRATIISGVYRDNLIKAAKPGRIRVYLDYRLVASLYPTQIQQNYIGAIR